MLGITPVYPQGRITILHCNEIDTLSTTIKIYEGHRALRILDILQELFRPLYNFVSIQMIFELCKIWFRRGSVSFKNLFINNESIC